MFKHFDNNLEDQTFRQKKVAADSRPDALSKFHLSFHLSAWKTRLPTVRIS